MRSFAKITKQQAGQAMVETAIVMPVMLLAGLGAFQLMLLQHARVLTEYASFNACRSGIVHNADRNIMRNAALISVLPVFGKTNDLLNFVTTYAGVKAVAEFGDATNTLVSEASEQMKSLIQESFGVTANLEAMVPDVSIVNVITLNPPASDLMFTNGRGEISNEIDFDDVLDPLHMKKNLLVIQTRIMVPLKIPLVNKIIFELWLAHYLLSTPPEYKLDVVTSAAFKSKVKMGEQVKDLEQALKQIDWKKSPSTARDAAAALRWNLEMPFIRAMADQGAYFIPVYANHAMQMQSNIYRNNLSPSLIDTGLEGIDAIVPELEDLDEIDETDVVDVILEL